MLEDIEDGFEAILTPGTEFLGQAPTEQGAVEEVATLFDAIAANYVGPVRQLMIELRLGDPPREWLDVVVPNMTSLKRSAQGMGLPELIAAAERFLAALDVAATSPDRMIRDPAKQLLVDAYADLAKALPEAFALDSDQSQRDTVILRTLLRQVPGLGKVALDKIYEAGLTTLDMFMSAKPSDLVVATGISLDLAERIVDRFGTYRNETASLIPEPPKSQKRPGILYDKKLTELVVELEKRHVAFERMVAAWGQQAVVERRRLRADRQATMLELNLLLARLGEVGLVEELEKASFERKIQILWKKLDDGKA